MPVYFILAQSEATAKALEQVLRIREGSLTKGGDDEDAFAAKLKGVCAFDGSELASPSGVLAAFRTFSSGFEPAIDVKAASCQVVVLVGRVDLERLNPIESDGWNTLVAMLILAFPEVRFLFGVCRAGADAAAQALGKRHALSRLFSPDWEPLFDATGLRNWVRLRAKHSNKTADVDQGFSSVEKRVSYLPLRNTLAAAVDDELSYAYFHAYTAYRFGFRSQVVTGFEQFVELFRETGSDGHPARCELILDDLFLNFPDRESLKSDPLPLSDLRQRMDRYPQIAKAQHWILITTGQRRPDDLEKWESNKELLRELREQGQHNKMLFKPTSGIFDLWEHCGMMERLPGRQEVEDEGGARKARTCAWLCLATPKNSQHP